MKAFLASVIALVVITLGAALLHGTVSRDTAQVYQSKPNVRL